jgi:hypothetical protein
VWQRERERPWRQRRPCAARRRAQQCRSRSARPPAPLLDVGGDGGDGGRSGCLLRGRRGLGGLGLGGHGAQRCGGRDAAGRAGPASPAGRGGLVVAGTGDARVEHLVVGGLVHDLDRVRLDDLDLDLVVVERQLAVQLLEDLVGLADAAGGEAVLAGVQDVELLGLLAGEVAAALDVVARPPLDHQHGAAAGLELVVQLVVLDHEGAAGGAAFAGRALGRPREVAAARLGRAAGRRTPPGPPGTTVLPTPRCCRPSLILR